MFRYQLINLFVFLSISFSYTQEKVILVNGNATKVELEGSKIVAIRGQLPNYMRGYIKPKSDIFKKTMPLSEREAYQGAESEIETFEPLPLVAENALYFNENMATLTDNTMTALKRYAQTVKSGEARTVSLKAWYTLGDTSSQRLVANRLDACKSFLEVNGVPSNLIFTSFTAAGELSEYVEITFQ
ncbi:MAG: hypothetical protein KJO50_05430 [Bacteroidia bacterium]|nr:hypothetical protein [Bacteroidia bacterium]